MLASPLSNTIASSCMQSLTEYFCPSVKASPCEIVTFIVKTTGAVALAAITVIGAAAWSAGTAPIWGPVVTIGGVLAGTVWKMVDNIAMRNLGGLKRKIGELGIEVKEHSINNKEHKVQIDKLQAQVQTHGENNETQAKHIDKQEEIIIKNERLIIKLQRILAMLDGTVTLNEAIKEEMTNLIKLQNKQHEEAERLNQVRENLQDEARGLNTTREKLQKEQEGLLQAQKNLLQQQLEITARLEALGKSVAVIRKVAVPDKGDRKRNRLGNESWKSIIRKIRVK